MSVASHSESRTAPGRPDYVLLGATTALVVIGTIMVYSASFVIAHNEFNDDFYFLTRQVIAVAMGAVALAVAMRVDYRRWRSLSLLAMLGCVALLLLVLVPGVGASSYGATRWIRLGPFFQLQPSELAKLAVVLYLADWLARRGRTLKAFSSGSLPFLIIVAIVSGLVEMQPDLGTTSVIVATAACVFFVAGANLWHVLAIMAATAAGGVLYLTRLSGYREHRITAFLDPWSDIQGAGWHTAQTLIALGSGGPFGLGLGDSHQKFYWVPNAHTDAIFAIIGEELGIVGTLTVLGLFVVVAWRGFLIAWRAPDTFGRLLATGLTALITLQALLNIAVVTNSVPYTGVPLPLVSFGGNSTLICMFAIGLLLSVSRYRPVVAADERSDQEEPGHATAPSVRARLRLPRPTALAHPTRPVRPLRALPAVRDVRGVPGGAQARPSRRRAVHRRGGEYGRRP